ncbi:hypothetical protein H0H92_012951 [Tricholoma furcatifolium]|nr:hypothetical protein H0H92_012951 [Tricholoma furcatifolium]
MVPPALLSRTLDPFLGVFTGFLAYYLHETHPRTALAPEDRLSALLRWKWSQQQEIKKEQLRILDKSS